MSLRNILAWNLDRRGFVLGVGAAGLASAVPVPPPSRNRFDLTIDRVAVNFTGSASVAIAVNGLVPGPILRWREGDTVVLNVTNRLAEPTSIHWHGIRVPTGMDGVPGFSFAGIAPGETFTYRIPVRQSGTYWYHSHSGLQEQAGLYGAIIVEPKAGYPDRFDRDYVVMLSDWSDTDPDRILANLKGQSDYYNYGQRTLGSFLADASKQGLRATIADRMQWGRMRMSPTDIADVSGATYTYLLNGQPPGAGWTGLFRPGERVRLRLINGSAMSFFDLRIPGLKMTVVEADGNEVVPVAVDELRIGVAETYDVIVEPSEDRAYTIFAQSEDRTGYASGTLATRAGERGAVPAMDPRPMRTMADMGMAGMSMGAGGGAQGSMPGMDMGGKSMPGMPAGDAPMPGMDMSNMDMGPGAKMNTAAAAGTEMGGMDMSQVPPDPAAAGLKGRVAVDNVAVAPSSRLQEAGAGLDNPARRVLTYADLRAIRKGIDPRPPSREIVLHLTGNMMRYMWGFDGLKYSQAEPIRLRLNERVRFVLVNDTMMEHPVHLHGLWSELDNGNGDYNPYKHTVIVKPGEKLSYLVTADTVGRWAYHCHLLYHMEMGMFREVIVA